MNEDKIAAYVAAKLTGQVLPGMQFRTPRGRLRVVDGPYNVAGYWYTSQWWGQNHPREDVVWGDVYILEHLEIAQ